MPKSFAQQIRNVMRIDLKDREEFTYDDIALRLDLLPGKPRKPLYRAMPEFIKRGVVVRVRTGVLSYKGKGYGQICMVGRQRVH